MRKKNKTQKTLKTNKTVKTPKKVAAKKVVQKRKTATVATKRIASVKRIQPAHAVKAKKAPTPKKRPVAINKTIKKPAKQAQTQPKPVVAKNVAKKPVKHVAKRSKAQSKAVVTKTNAPHTLYQKDLQTLSNGFWGNLDLLCFTQIPLDDITSDVIYASDDVGVVVKVLSTEGTWQVDTKLDIWKNGNTKLIEPIAELTQICTLLHQKEPDCTLIPTLVLMRGAIKNEKTVETYLNAQGIRLVKVDDSVSAQLPLLFHVLRSSFSPIITPLDVSDQAFSLQENQALIAQRYAKPRRHSLAHKLSKHLASNIATVAHTGDFPIASGTIGSLIALPIAYALNHISVLALWAMIIVTFFIGTWATNRFTKNKVEKDPSSVIIDEVVGQSIPFAFVAPGLLHIPLLIAGFVLFRFFDICKFGLVKYFDQEKNAWGVMMDDVIAGLQTAFILVLLQMWYLT